MTSSRPTAARLVLCALLLLAATSVAREPADNPPVPLGRAELEVRFDGRGSVEEATLLQSSGDQEFDARILRELKLETFRRLPDLGADTPSTVRLRYDSPGPEGAAGPPESGTVQPRVLRWVSPPYPEKARLRRSQGTVIVKVRVATDGRVDKVEVLNPVTPQLDAAAAWAAWNCRFVPGREGCNDVPMWMALPFRFVLEDDS